MTNLENTIEPKSDQLNADDFITRPKTIKITSVKVTTGDQPVSIHYERDSGKPFKPCKSMRRVLIQVWGSDGDTYAGKSMTLYNDPTVKWAGKEVGGIRISHMSHIEEPKSIMLTIRKAMRVLFRVDVLKVPVKELIETTEPQVNDFVAKWSDWIDGQLSTNENMSAQQMDEIRTYVEKESESKEVLEYFDMVRGSF